MYTGPVRTAVHQLKYARNVALGDTFSKYLCDLLVDFNWKIDIITPVPLGAARKKTRGFNQAALLAKPIALKLKIRYKPGMISRTRETLSQVNLNREQRKRNVAGAFRARVNITRGNNILIIDDVATSLSTLDSCAEALLSAGAKKVYGLTLARAG
jgi:ComF family protein